MFLGLLEDICYIITWVNPSISQVFYGLLEYALYIPSGSLGQILLPNLPIVSAAVQLV